MRRVVLPLLLFALLPLAAAGTPQVGIPTGSSQACPTGSGQYTMTVHNPGPASDRYEIEVDAPSTDAVTLSTSNIEVAAGETEEVFVWVQAPSSASPGDYDVTVRATSSNNGKTVTETEELTVPSCRDVSISPVDPRQSVCRGDEATYRFDIRNQGVVEETYRLTTGSGTLSTGRVTLDSGARKRVTLSIASDTATSRNITVRAASTTSYASDTAEVSFVSKECRSVDVTAAPQNASICRSDSILVSAAVENTGSIRDTYTVSIGDWRRNVSLAAGATRTLEREVAASLIDGNIQTSATSTSLAAVADTAVTSVNVDSCYGLRLEPVSTAPAQGNQTLLELSLTNNGTHANNYTLQLDGPDWMDVEPGKVALGPGESSQVFLYAAPDFFGDGTYTAALVASGTGASTTLEMNATARNGTVSIALPATATPTGQVGRGTSSLIAVLFTVLVLLGGGYYIFYREQDRDEEE